MVDSGIWFDDEGIQVVGVKESVWLLLGAEAWDVRYGCVEPRLDRTSSLNQAMQFLQLDTSDVKNSKLLLKTFGTKHKEAASSKAYRRNLNRMKQ